MNNVVQLQGAMNCRDVGGYPTSDGRRVRTGALFRSDRLSDLTDDDLEELASYGIRTVVDFRTEADQPGRVATDDLDAVIDNWAIVVVDVDGESGSEN